MNIYTSLLLYVFLLLKNNLVESLELQFKFKGSNKINDKSAYWLLRVSETEGHYFFHSLASCIKVLADGVLLWKLNHQGMCPRAVSYFGTDEVAINFPEELMLFKKRDGEWVNVHAKDQQVKLDHNSPVEESDYHAKDKADHPAAQEVELPHKLRKEPNYDLPRDIKGDLLTDSYKLKEPGPVEQEPVLPSPEPTPAPAEPVQTAAEDGGAPADSSENE